MADWSLLPEELLRLVLNKLSSPRDNARSSAVCKLWHSIYKEKTFPWFMLSDHDRENNNTRGFFSLYDHQVYRISLPELEDKFVCGSSHGWLITIGFDHILHLLHPFSRTQIQLPPPPGQKERLEGEDEYFTKERLRNGHMKKVIMSSNPFTNPADCIIMAIDHNHNLVYCRLGGEAWTSFPYMRGESFTDVIYYKGEFYAVSSYQIYIFHIDSAPHATAFGPKTPRLFRGCLVNLAGDLLIVDRYYSISSQKDKEHEANSYGDTNNGGENKDIHDTSGNRDENEEEEEEEEELVGLGEGHFDVFKLDAEISAWTEVKDIRDHALFLGFNNSVALPPSSFPGCIENSIYFGDIHWDTFFRRLYKDMGIFLVKEKRVHSVYPRLAFDDLAPSSPPILIISRTPSDG